MPLMTAKQRGVRRQSNVVGRWSGFANSGTALPCDATDHVEGVATEIIASTSFDTDWVCIRFHSTAFTGRITDKLVNIKVGGAGVEQTIIPNLFAGWASVQRPFMQYEFPLRIPAGSRITGTCRGVDTAYEAHCFIELFGGGDGHHWVGTGVEAVGADTATSGGVAVTPGTTSEGTLTSIGTSTYDWGYVLPMQSSNADISLSSGINAYDIASGATTADLIPGLEDFFSTSNSSEYYVQFPLGRYCHIPAGTTLYLRSQFSTTAEAKDHIIYGVF